MTIMIMYLAFFGGSRGWDMLLTRYIDLGLLIILTVYALRHVRRWGIVEQLGVAAIAVHATAGAINQVSMGWVGWRALTLSGYIGMYLWCKRHPPGDKHIIAAGWGLWALTMMFWTASGFRRMWFLDNPNITGAVFLLLWPVGVGNLRGIWRWLWIAAGTLSILSTGSRSAAGGLTTAAVYMLNAPGWASIFSGVAALVFQYTQTPINASSGERFMYHTSRSTVRTRLKMYQRALQNLIDSPGLGRGPYSIIQMDNAIHAHNMWLTWGSDTGAAGLTLITAITQTVLRKRSRWVNAALLGWSVSQLTDDTLWFMSVGLVVMMLLARD